MSTLLTHKTNFTSGEISSDVWGRTDIAAYDNGALKLKNVFIDPIGGIRRRDGLRYIDSVSNAMRLISFSPSPTQDFLLVLSPNQMDIYHDEEKLSTLATPWGANEIPFIFWTQSSNALLIVHPDVAPCKLTRASNGTWQISLWTFETTEDGKKQMPFEQFQAEGTLLTPSGASGNITLTTSSDHFTENHIGTRFRLHGGEVEITAVLSATQASATVKKNLSALTATTDWTEQAFSAVRGYPATVTFYQGRLVIGGSRDLPNKLWFSKTFHAMNFDLGTGLDDEAISFSILSDEVNAIRAIVSGRHLQVFTSGSEWMVSGDPLTPQNIQLKRQTKIGSPVYATLIPTDVSGATIFVSADGREVREFLFEDLEQAYQAKNLSLLSGHLIKKPLDMAYDPMRRLVFFVMQDGTLATLTNYRSEEIMAWSAQETDGHFIAVSVIRDQVFVLVNRNNQIMLETFDEGVHTDCAFWGEEEQICTTWDGFTPLIGKTVKVKADDTLLQDKTITSDTLILEKGCKKLEVGLPFEHMIIPLPPTNRLETDTPLKAVRLIEVRFRVIDTFSLTVDVGSGFQEYLLPVISSSYVFDKPFEKTTRDICVHALGWCRDGMTPLWQIASDIPSPCKIVSITTKMKVSE